MSLNWELSNDPLADDEVTAEVGIDEIPDEDDEYTYEFDPDERDRWEAIEDEPVHIPIPGYVDEILDEDDEYTDEFEPSRKPRRKYVGGDEIRGIPRDKFDPDTGGKVRFGWWDAKGLGDLGYQNRYHCAVDVPFTLHPPSPDVFFPWVEVHFRLDDPTHIASTLAPDQIKAVEKNKRYWLSPSIEFSGVKASIGGAEYSIKYNQVDPRIVAMDQGLSRFSWLHTNENGVQHGRKHATMILRVPEGEYEVSGSVYYYFLTEKERLGEIRGKPSYTRSFDFSWQLPEKGVKADGQMDPDFL